MENPIKYGDLFSESLVNDIGELKTALEGVQTKMQSMVKDIKSAASGIKGAFDQTKSSSGTTNKTIEDMYNSYTKLQGAINEVSGNLLNLQRDGKEVIFTQKEINKVVKLGDGINRKSAETYNNLSKQYSMLKILINNLTKAERENTDAGRALVQNAKDIYEKMNMLQQKTGKYQLQVGNYSKALGGLQLATNQVIRELPVLSNGLSMFVMAISNNIPILLDNIKIFKQEQAELAAQGKATMSVAEGMLKSIFSWQTAIIVLLSVLPAIIKKIKEKKEAQKGLNGETIKAIDYEKELLEAMKNASSGYVEKSEKMKLLYEEAQDENRTMKERLEIGQLLIDQFGEEFEGYSAEEIVQGKAISRYNKITEALMRQAKAKAYVDKITELEKQRLEAILDREAKEEEIEKKRKEREELRKRTSAEMGSVAGAPTITTYGAEGLSAAVTTGVQGVISEAPLTKEIKALDDQIEALEERERTAKDAVERITDLLSSEDFTTLFEEEGGAGRGTTSRTKEIAIKDMEYIDQLIKAQYGLIEDEQEREIALSEYGYQRQIQDLKNYRDEQKELMKTGLSELTPAGLEAIDALISALGLEMEKKTAEIREDYRKKQEKEDEKMREDLFKGELDGLKKHLDTLDNEAQKRNKNKIRRNREFLKNEIAYLKEYKEVLKEYGKLTPELEKNIDANIERAESQMGEATPRNFIDLIGVFANEEYSRQFESGIKNAFKTAFSYMDQWMDKRMEMAKVAVESAQREVDATKEALDIEQQARVNGYAHNVGLARKEYQEQLDIRRQALAEEERVAKIQQSIDDAQQISSLLVATANLWATNSKIPVVGSVLAGIATATMWGSFAAAKIQASNLVKTKNYGEGMSEYLDYGGSHASGNDIDFGTMKDGTRRRVERGEMVAVINKRNVSKYGKDNISDIIKSLNTGTFDDRYGLAFAGVGLGTGNTNLTHLEQGIDTLVSQGEKRIVVSGGKTIEYYKNTKRIIRN